MIIADSKVYKNNQTCIPKEIREKYNIDENTIVEWGINDNGDPEIRFRKKRNLKDINGIIEVDYPTDSVQLKKELYL